MDLRSDRLVFHVMNIDTEYAPRRVKASDLPDLARMRTSLWSDSTHPEAESALQAHQQGDRFILVVERAEGAGLCAFAEAAIRPHAEGCTTTPVAYLEGIWVDDDVRRAGIAEALVEGVADWAKRRGLRELGSDTGVSDDASRSFHRAIGFEEVGTIVCFRRAL